MVLLWSDGESFYNLLLVRNLLITLPILFPGQWRILCTSVDRAANWPNGQGIVHILCTSVDRPVDRALVWSTGRSTARSPKPDFKGLKMQLVNSLKIQMKYIKFQENKFLLTLWNTNMCDKKSTFITNYLNYFFGMKLNLKTINDIFQN